MLPSFPDAARDEVARLVKKFKALSAPARRGMNEAQTRQGYILPLFVALGWDISNISEVTPEEKVSRGWVDYSFRLAGIPRFFLETKKVDEDLNDPRWVRQAIDYAWTKSVTWALLSDFEGLRVFNAEWKEENPFRAEFFQFTVDTYLSNFDQLWWLSRSETASGRLDREADKVGKRSRREAVSQHLFDDLKKWRGELYRNLSQRNPVFSAHDIDQSVLRIINRLVFIRTAEDREVEPVRLRPLLRELADRRRLGDLPRELAMLFREFDATYNSELFAQHFSEGLDCESKPYEDLIADLYEKRYVRYNFNAIDADVLGTAYEQYLGSSIGSANGNRLISTGPEVVEKQQKRKSQGIYYTPTFVVKYIVRQTVGRYLEENGYNPSRPARVLDMACGSGSFLIEAFDTLDRFVAQQRGHIHGEREDMHDYARRIEILTQCIYGVDKDKQAVEVARLNLLLRALHTREKLPMLHNIREGDSLIVDAWEKQFPAVMRDGGFDVIIGNPPYVRQETLGESFKAYAQKNFATYAGTADLYIYFIEQAHRLLKPDGYFGMIVSNKWMRSNYGKALRDFLASQATLLEIIDFGELPVFETAATFPAIIITRKQPTQKQGFLYAPIKRLDFASLDEEARAVGTTLDERALQGENWALTNDRERPILEKMRQVGTPLGEYIGSNIYRGIITGYGEAFVINRAERVQIVATDPHSTELIKPFVVGDDVRKYRINFQDTHVICIPKGWTQANMGKAKDAWGWFKKNYPALAKHLQPHAAAAEKRQDKGEFWWELRACDYYNKFEEPKIVYPDIAKESRAAFDTQGRYFSNTVYFIPKSDLYLLGLLNSKLIFNYFKRIASVLGDPDKGGRLRWFQQDVVKIPIRAINFADPADKARHDGIVALVEEMLELQKQHADAERGLDDRRHALKRRIEEVDREIDRRVYDLYRLTQEDVKVVEGKV